MTSNMETCSCLLSDILNCVGYDLTMINVRRNVWQLMSKIHNIRQQKITVLIVGSKGEGITSYTQSDIDDMFLLNDVICTDDVRSLPSVSDMTVLQTDEGNTPPGYTRLRLVYCNGATSNAKIRENLFESESKQLYLSSSMIVSSFKRHSVENEPGSYNFRTGEISGPSVPGSTRSLSFDRVVALPCKHSQILESWKSRWRPFHWPSTDVRDAAASVLAQVVPVGSKGSCDQWREWRFCFIPSELKLTCSLNETQIKLYILLKMVAKEILKIVSDEISSFIMKNIVFWLSELLPDFFFRKQNLLSLLLQSLRFLQVSIAYWNLLPYYMIPHRNLLAERLSNDGKRRLLDLIETLITEGPRLILRCTKLRECLSVNIISTPLLVDQKKFRDSVEIVSYIHMIFLLMKADESVSTKVCHILHDLVIPEWRQLLRCNVPVIIIEYLCEKTIKYILS